MMNDPKTYSNIPLGNETAYENEHSSMRNGARSRENYPQVRQENDVSNDVRQVSNQFSNLQVNNNYQYGGQQPISMNGRKQASNVPTMEYMNPEVPKLSYENRKGYPSAPNVPQVTSEYKTYPSPPMNYVANSFGPNVTSNYTNPTQQMQTDNRPYSVHGSFAPPSRQTDYAANVSENMMDKNRAQYEARNTDTNDYTSHPSAYEVPLTNQRETSSVDLVYNAPDEKETGQQDITGKRFLRTLAKYTTQQSVEEMDNSKELPGPKRTPWNEPFEKSPASEYPRQGLATIFPQESVAGLSTARSSVGPPLIPQSHIENVGNAQGLPGQSDVVKTYFPEDSRKSQISPSNDAFPAQDTQVSNVSNSPFLSEEKFQTLSNLNVTHNLESQRPSQLQESTFSPRSHPVSQTSSSSIIQTGHLMNASIQGQAAQANSSSSEVELSAETNFHRVSNSRSPVQHNQSLPTSNAPLQSLPPADYWKNKLEKFDSANRDKGSSFFQPQQRRSPSVAPVIPFLPEQQDKPTKQPFIPQLGSRQSPAQVMPFNYGESNSQGFQEQNRSSFVAPVGPYVPEQASVSFESEVDTNRTHAAQGPLYLHPTSNVSSGPLLNQQRPTPGHLGNTSLSENLSTPQSQVPYMNPRTGSSVANATSSLYRNDQGSNAANTTFGESFSNQAAQQPKSNFEPSHSNSGNSNSTGSSSMLQPRPASLSSSLAGVPPSAGDNQPPRSLYKERNFPSSITRDSRLDAMSHSNQPSGAPYFENKQTPTHLLTSPPMSQNRSSQVQSLQGIPPPTGNLVDRPNTSNIQEGSPIGVQKNVYLQRANDSYPSNTYYQPDAQKTYQQSHSEDIRYPPVSSTAGPNSPPTSQYLDRERRFPPQKLGPDSENEMMPNTTFARRGHYPSAYPSAVPGATGSQMVNSPTQYGSFAPPPGGNNMANPMSGPSYPSTAPPHTQQGAFLSNSGMETAGYQSQHPNMPPYQPKQEFGMSQQVGSPTYQDPYQQRKLDPDMMPNPIQVTQEDREQHENKRLVTNAVGLLPPLVTTRFIVEDQGNASPRYIRSTVYSVPCTAELVKQSNIPVALVISPLAKILDEEHPPPIVGSVDGIGPVRCVRCKAYMNPFMQFIDGGRRFLCGLCKATTEVPAEYFQHLDHTGYRVDRYERPELVLGAYEFLCTPEYCKDNKFPNIPAIIFLIDVSYNNVKSGMLNLLCENMMDILDLLPREYGKDVTDLRVGFITYDKVIHFYSIKPCLLQPQMMIVSDIDDVFVPLVDGFLCNPYESREIIQTLMQQIPTMFANTRETETILAPVIQAALEAFKASDCAGKIIVFNSSMPSAEAPGKLVNREDRKLLGTDKEKTILNPQNSVYAELGRECVKAGCGVDLFIFNNSYVDLATIGQVSKFSGGEVYKYTYFQADLDGERFIMDIKKNVSQDTVFDAVMRVRTSAGIRPVQFFGHFHMNTTTDVELGYLDSRKSIGIELKHDNKLSEEQGVLIQVALLHTSCSGQRRVRVLNLSLKCCSQITELFRHCELDTMMNYIGKSAVCKLLDNNPKQVKESILHRSAQILACYRKICATASSPGQLILPECMKLLPIFTNCLLKNDALSGGSDMTIDDRWLMMDNLLVMDIMSSVVFLYPQLLPIAEIDLNVDVPLPIRCTTVKMNSGGAYLLENGVYMFIWLGLNLSPEWIMKIFGVHSLQQVDVDAQAIPRLDNEYSRWLNSLITTLRLERRYAMRLTLIREGDKMDVMFRHFLAEDTVGTGPDLVSYVEFLCNMHREIRQLMH